MGGSSFFRSDFGCGWVDEFLVQEHIYNGLLHVPVRVARGEKVLNSWLRRDPAREQASPPFSSSQVAELQFFRTGFKRCHAKCAFSHVSPSCGEAAIKISKDAGMGTRACRIHLSCSPTPRVEDLTVFEKSRSRQRNKKQNGIPPGLGFVVCLFFCSPGGFRSPCKASGKLLCKFELCQAVTSRVPLQDPTGIQLQHPQVVLSVFLGAMFRGETKRNRPKTKKASIPPPNT